MRSAVLAGVILAIGVLGAAAPSHAAGQAPDSRSCNDATNPPKDPVTQGGCLAIARAKGNCQACHFVAGTASGNIAPPLVSMAQRFPDKSRLRAQIEDPRQFNSHSVMPPYGKHLILNSDEIDKVIAWLMTL
jgi:sulfur-oxidizing protein SoxX